MRRYLIAGVLLVVLGSLAECGGERPSERPPTAPRPPQIRRIPAVPLSLAALQSGPPRVQILAAGQIRSYTFSLEEGQYLHGIVQQLGVDVVVRILDPDGHLLLRVDSPNGAVGPEAVFLVAGKTGRHLLEIQAPNGTGRYEIHVEALRAATSADQTRAAAAAAYSRARIFERGGENASAAESYREAARLWGKVGGEAQQARALYLLGVRLTEEPVHLREGIQALEDALGLYQRVGDRHEEGVTLYYLGRAWNKAREVEPALRRYEQALALWRELGDFFEQATCLNNLATVRLRQGRLHAAIELYSQAIEVSRRHGDGPNEAITRTNLGLLYANLGEGRLALAQYRRALAMLDRQPESTGVAAQRAITLSKLGDVLLWMEGPAPALVRLREALV